MGNRTFLYLVRSNDEDDVDEIEIAEANNLLPSLWHVLLADAEPAAPIDHQRVFGDAGTANVGAPAAPALQRLQRLGTWLHGHPRFAEVPGLGLYLDAAHAHLSRLLDEGDDSDGDAAPLLSANLDELSWLESTTPERFIAKTLAQFRATWATLDALIEAGRYEGLEEALGFNEWNVGFTDWKAWSTVFGLALFSHPYFFGTWDEPRTVAFDDFDEEEAELSGNAYLGAGCERFQDGDLWGVRRAPREEGAGRVISPPQWQKIKAVPGDDGPAELPDEDHRCWAMRDGKYALMALAGPQAGALLTAHEFEDAWGFDANGLGIVKQHDRMGFLKRDGSWHLTPRWNEVWRFENGLAIVSHNGASGYIDIDGRAVFEPRFDEAHPFTADGTAMAQEGQHWSLLQRDGGVVVSGCSVLYWSDDFEGWLAEKNGLSGLFHADGSPWLPIAFESIRFVARKQPIVVTCGGLAGLRAWRGEELLPGRYPALRAIATAERDLRRSASHGAGLFVATDAQQRAGLIDAAGRILVPFQFASIDLFASQHGPRSKVENSRQVRVGQGDGVSGDVAYGIWDIDQARLMLPCEFRHVWLVMLGALHSHGFLVAKGTAPAQARTLGKHAIRLLKADGEPLFPQTFSWVGRKLDLDRHGAMEQIREALYLAWATGRSVPAALAKKGPEIQLKCDGTWLA
jgi:uncharacterized protein